ncbi:MAG: ferritin family protein, partial [Candidatus Zixiibacteriota bacterium]
MNVFEFAMKMEQDGKAFYEKMAKEAANASIKKILLDLANDEQKHYNIFKKFSQGDFSGVSELKATGT